MYELFSKQTHVLNSELLTSKTVIVRPRRVRSSFAFTTNINIFCDSFNNVQIYSYSPV